MKKLAQKHQFEIMDNEAILISPDDLKLFFQLQRNCRKQILNEGSHIPEFKQ
jgi:hypothetical protein